jgi:DNA-directed RNA polymerase subunit RPC12/RpoP
MRQSDVACTKCRAGFQRLELVSLPNQDGEYRCPICGEVLEVFNGEGVFVGYRLTNPSKSKERSGATARQRS